MPDALNRFYTDNIADARLQGTTLSAPCPFCLQKQKTSPGTLSVILDSESYFYGYFNCSNHCSHGGFPLYFARRMKIPRYRVPGYDPDRDYYGNDIDLPVKNMNDEVLDFIKKLPQQQLDWYRQHHISKQVLQLFKIGHNGRYLVYPFAQNDENIYSSRCVHPAKPEDSFWYGNEAFFSGAYHLFNRPEVERCENGALILVEGEDNLLCLKQLGLPGMAVPAAADLEHIDQRTFAYIQVLFLWVNNSADSFAAARSFATRVGFKVRLVRWEEDHLKDCSLMQLAADQGEQDFRSNVLAMLARSRAFSPFASPEKEYSVFAEKLIRESRNAEDMAFSGFSLLDKTLGRFQGISIMGGTPKAGKSCFFMQIAFEMALKKVPVIYYDFENGKQKIYLRTLSRISRVSDEQIFRNQLGEPQKQALRLATGKLKKALHWFRVVNDRQLSPQTMRHHVDFLRHETKTNRIMVVIDSLHKLPFKDLSQRRSGIDGWLRQLEAIRDELDVSFLVISELARGQDGQFERHPSLGSFKGSGDIAYSADNALVLLPDWDPFDNQPPQTRINDLWLVASREHAPGKIARYQLDYPYWGFTEKEE
ncbi:MAG: DNA helicase [Deltaproteobacteria bacterium]|nr:MAG: DNA helicase [Deltaproteobacteria bacterium]